MNRIINAVFLSGVIALYFSPSTYAAPSKVFKCSAHRYSFKNPENFTKKETHEISKKVIDLVRLTLGYYYDKEAHSSYNKYRNSIEFLKGIYPIEDYFEHENFIEANRPKDLGKHLENRIKIKVQTGGEGLSYTFCEARLHKYQPMCMYSSHGETAKAYNLMINQ